MKAVCSKCGQEVVLNQKQIKMTKYEADNDVVPFTISQDVWFSHRDGTAQCGEGISFVQEEEGYLLYDWSEEVSMDNGFGFGLLAILVTALNIAFWGGLIYFCFWCAQHFGLI